MYKLTNDINVIQRIADGAFIPVELNNTDYQKFLQWISEGNEIEDATD